MRIARKSFWISLFVAQNRWHKHGVLLHTLKVTWQLIKNKQWKMVPAGLLHDIGKPFVAFQDETDLKRDYISYSFLNHEEASYQIIKNWPFISTYTKILVRYHYIIRDMQKSKEKGRLARYARLRRIWDKMDRETKDDLAIFMRCDDLGKG